MKSFKFSTMKFLKLLSFLAVICLINSCSKDVMLEPQNDDSSISGDLLKSGKMSLNIAVVSDIHYLAASLLRNDAANGAAFQNYLAADPKLIEYSIPILDKVVSELEREKPDILLIPGDLTKDGEKLSHLAVAKILHRLACEGIKVFVIPGNHDINNPQSKGYRGQNSYETGTVSPERFAAIYDEFGYRNAKYRDPHSLSYICQVKRDLWILGIDDCKYDQNIGATVPEVSGKIRSETMHWIKDKMKNAKKEKVTVLAMMHHGIMEHYNGQEQLDPGYVVDDWQSVAPELMEAGIQVFFTGHYHANDITELQSNGKTLYDIQTGSLVSTPSPYRLIKYSGNALNISTAHVESIHARIPNGLSFVDYSTLFHQQHFDGYFGYYLQLKGLDGSTAAYFAPRFRNAIMAHYAGDEKITGDEQLEVNELLGVSEELWGAVMTLWTDLPPIDNELRLELN